MTRLRKHLARARRDRGVMISLVVVLAALAILLPAAVLAKKPPPPPVTIQILNVSDWHGNVDPVTNIGGAWNLSDRWQQDRLAYPSLTLTAGDDFGATPPLSGFFNEVPAIKAQRLMGIQVGALGNHNFDRGIDHLQRMIDLAGAPTSADAPGQPVPIPRRESRPQRRAERRGWHCLLRRRWHPSRCDRHHQ